jgi:PAS domain S-box-containing protein
MAPPGQPGSNASHPIHAGSPATDHSAELQRIPADALDLLMTHTDDIVYGVEEAYAERYSGRVLFVSKGVESTLGRSPGDFMTDPGLWISLVHPHDMEALNKDTDKLFLDGTPITRTYRMRRSPDGEYRWIEDRVVPYRNVSGEIAGIIGIARDVTQRKLVDDALRQHELRLQMIYDAVGDVIFELAVEADGLYRFASVNQRFCTVTGLPMHAVVGRLINEVIPESSVEFVLEKYRQAIEEKRAVRWEEVSQYPTGILTGEVCVVPKFDTAGHCIHLIGSVHDVTERQQAVEALRESESRLRAIYENVSVGLAFGDLAGNFLDVNPALQRILGYSLDDLRTLTIADITHPDDLASDYALFQQVLAGERQQYKIEKRYHHKDGHIIWGLMSVSLVRDAKGTPLYTIGMLDDITEHKLFEETLRLSETKYRSLYESMMDGFVRVDMQGLIQECNESFRKIVQYSNEELLRMSYPDLTPERWHSFEQELVRTQILPRGYSDVYEKEYHRKDGSITPVELRTFLLRSSTGEPEGMWAIVRDISDRKKAESQLRSSEDTLRRLAIHQEMVREEERRAVAREVHDEIGQIFTAIRLHLTDLLRSGTRSRLKFAKKTAEILELVDVGTKSVQQISSTLRPRILDDLGLIPALKWLTEEFRARTGIHCAQFFPEADQGCNADEATVVFRICQEALTNVTRHANASEVSVRFERGSEGVALSVADNGMGIDERLIHDARSVGLTGMKERMLRIGGTFSISRRPEGGTCIVARIPP